MVYPVLFAPLHSALSIISVHSKQHFLANKLFRKRKSKRNCLIRWRKRGMGAAGSRSPSPHLQKLGNFIKKTCGASSVPLLPYYKTNFWMPR